MSRALCWKRMPPEAFYAVRRGRKTGVFKSWAGEGGAKEQVSGFKRSLLKKFSTLSAAENWVKAGRDSCCSSTLHAINRDSQSNRTGPKVTKKTKTPSSKISRALSTDVQLLHQREKEVSERVVVYTDGCCKPVGGSGRSNRKRHNCERIAGIGIHFPDNSHLNLSAPMRQEPYTNQRAELEAAIEAIKVSRENCLDKLCLYTDSMYVINGISNWIAKWKRNGWQTVNKSDVLNKDLWMQLDLAISSIDAKFVHVFGHTGVEGNEIADRLANEGAEQLLFLSTEQPNEVASTKIDSKNICCPVNMNSNK